MMNSEHKTTSKNYRDHYDEIFRKDQKDEQKNRKNPDKD